jgi:hypothetical protein
MSLTVVDGDTRREVVSCPAYTRTSEMPSSLSSLLLKMTMEAMAPARLQSSGNDAQRDLPSEHDPLTPAAHSGTPDA